MKGSSRKPGGLRPGVLATLGCLPLLAACGGGAGALRVNQVGYLPKAPKYAVVQREEASPLPWELRDGSGNVVASGQSQPLGEDSDSGEKLHLLDLSSYETASKGLRVELGGESSPAFDVGPDVYHQLKYDALRYFFYNRSGIPIALPYALDFKWTRPAGHLSDSSVGCPAETCKYKLDVHGGWYDAGDHGKYVVNGGIAAWTLLDLWERTHYLGASEADFGDGKLNIPESGNNRPDLLDEARWEIEFMMRMQVPEGQDKAGMVHHKIHDTFWTPLGTTPPSHTDTRYLHPVSTAATLNLAAVGAQCARVYRTVAPAFASKCLKSAVRAWNAALANPKMFASPMDNMGGGPYDDLDVSDEQYWAAAELYLTLGTEELLKFVVESPHYASMGIGSTHEKVSEFTSMTWQSTAALGTISLAVVTDAGSAELASKARQSVAQAAEQYLEAIAQQGFRLPMRRGSDGHYPWGSNSFVANNGVVLALAYDLTGDAKYLGGATQALDYLLGRNPLGLSYVTGYGFEPVENPHHRHWAHSRNLRIPVPPPGALVGGPNSKLQDPTSKRRLNGCAPLRCYTDSVDAWSVNEVAINWNAPLAWLSAFADEQGQREAGKLPAWKAPALPTGTGPKTAPKGESAQPTPKVTPPPAEPAPAAVPPAVASPAEAAVAPAGQSTPSPDKASAPKSSPSVPAATAAAPAEPATAGKAPPSGKSAPASPPKAGAAPAKDAKPCPPAGEPAPAPKPSGKKGTRKPSGFCSPFD